MARTKTGNIPQWVRDQGLCFTCREKPHAEGINYCEECNQKRLKNNSRSNNYHKERHAERFAKGLCIKCEKPNQNGCKNCNECLAARRAVTQELKSKNLCLKCREPVDQEGYSYCQDCLGRFSPDSADWNLKLKLETMEAYGGVKCACCGVSNHHCLNIDHIENNGSEHRKVTGGGGQKTYLWLKENDYPPGYQVLCFNCNFLKYRSGQIPTVELLYTSEQTTPLGTLVVNTFHSESDTVPIVYQF